MINTNEEALGSIKIISKENAQNRSLLLFDLMKESFIVKFNKYDFDLLLKVQIRIVTNLCCILTLEMAQAQEAKESSALSSCDAYFEKIKSRKKLPLPLQETLTAAFARIPVSSFPQVPAGKGDCKSFIASTT